MQNARAALALSLSFSELAWIAAFFISLIYLSEKQLFQEEVQATRIKLKDCKNQVARLKKVLDDTRGELNEAREEARKLKQDLDKKDADLRVKLQETKLKAAQLATAMKRIAELERKLAIADARIAELERKLVIADARIAELERKLAIADDRMAELERKLLSPDEITEKLETESTTPEERIAALERRLVTANERIAQLECQLEDANERIEELETQLEDSEAQGRRIHPEIFGLKGDFKHVVFVVDSSGSMLDRSREMDRGDRWEHARGIIRTWMQHLDMGECALITFNTEVSVFRANDKVFFRLGDHEKRKNNEDLLLEHLEKMTPEGKTNTLGALQTAYGLTSVDTILLFTDGEPTGKKSKYFDRKLAKKIYELCEQHPGIPVNTIGLGNYFEEDLSNFLLNVAEITGGTFLGR